MTFLALDPGPEPDQDCDFEISGFGSGLCFSYMLDPEPDGDF